MIKISNKTHKKDKNDKDDSDKDDSDNDGMKMPVINISTVKKRCNLENVNSFKF